MLGKRLDHADNLRGVVSALKNGDQKAFEEIYEYFGGQLLHYSYRHVKSHELAEEIVHDVFVKLWQHREDINEESPIKPYLFTICRNHILNTLRKVSLNVTHQTEKDLEHKESTDPENQMIIAEYRESRSGNCQPSGTMEAESITS